MQFRPQASVFPRARSLNRVRDSASGTPNGIARLSSWLVLSTLLTLGAQSSAETLTWDADPVTTGAQDGGGTWTNGGTANWRNPIPANVPWNSVTPDSAIFGAASGTGTVTVNTPGGVTVGGISFNTAYTLAGTGVNGTITFADGVTVQNITTTNLARLSAPLVTTGTVTISGSRIWMRNPSFAGGGTLNINTSNGLLFENGGALDGLKTINLNSGGIDIRQNASGTNYNYAAGTVLNVTNSLSLTTNTPPDVRWLGDVVVTGGKTFTIGALTGASAGPPSTPATQLTLSGSIAESGGAANLTITGAGITILAGANTFSGTTSVSTTSSLVLAHEKALQKSTLISTGAGVTFDSSVASHAFSIGGLGTNTNFALQDNAATPNAVTLTVGGNGSTSTYSGSFSGAGGLTKIGSGTLTLTNFSSYTGNTTVNGGALTITFNTANTDNLLNPNSKLVLGGGTFNEVQTKTPNNQTFNGLTLNAGASVINQKRVGSGVMLLNLGDVVRNVGSTVNFGANGNSSTAGITSNATNGASGILGGYATYEAGSNGDATTSGGTDWATVNSEGRIVILPSGSYRTTAATTVTTHLDMTASVALNANVTTGSVRFNDAIASPTLTLNGVNTIDSGGILVTSAVGANASLITGGTSLTSGNGQDLIIHQNNANASGALTIASKITGAGIGLTKSGAGTLVLTAANDYTGATTVNTGLLSVSGSIAGSATTVNNSGTLGGTGTTGAVSVNDGGNIAPGASTIGTLRTGSVNLLSNATFKLEINTTTLTTDVLAITGNLSLASTNDVVLNITDLAPGSMPGPLVFITYTGVWTGGLFTYNSTVLTDGATVMVGTQEYVFDYDYQGNSVALVPEPGAFVSLLGGIGLLLGLSRFRRLRAA